MVQEKRFPKYEVLTQRTHGVVPWFVHHFFFGLHCPKMAERGVSPVLSKYSDLDAGIKNGKLGEVWIGSRRFQKRCGHEPRGVLGLGMYLNGMHKILCGSNLPFASQDRWFFRAAGIQISEHRSAMPRVRP